MDHESSVVDADDGVVEDDAPLDDDIAGTQAATTTNWGGGAVAQPLPDTCLDDPSIEACCSPTQQVWIGTDGADAYWLGLVASPGRCAFAEGGDDHLRLTALRDFASGGEGNDVIELRNGGDAAIGGPGHDRLTGGIGGDTLYGQDGDDILQPGAGPDWVDAGPGDDAIDCSLGADTIFPGPGRDTVEGGPGDDHVWIRSSCEVESGEILRGGLGHDTLLTASPIEDLLALGVQVQGFETIDVLSDALPSSCDACASSADCAPERPICTQLREGVATCRCEPRFTGDGCTECAEGGSGDDCLTCLPGYHLEHVTRGTHPRDEAMLDAPDPEQPVAPEAPGEFRCVPDPNLHCATSPEDGGLWCSGRGSCGDDGAGNAACTCDAGYAGALCDQCDAGMERNEHGECVFGQTCRDDACHGAAPNRAKPSTSRQPH
jgi:Ca2+-binding RTX toxin-like protein